MLVHRSRVEFVEHLSDEIQTMVRKGQEDYETSHGVVCDYRNFWLLVRDANEKVIGYLAYYTAYAEVYVDDLWVAGNHRCAGLGRTLLSTLEKRVQGSGYNNINLVTNGFQAVEFYKKCGYEVEFVRVNEHHPKLTKTFFVKYFESKKQTRGVLSRGGDD